MVQGPQFFESNGFDQEIRGDSFRARILESELRRHKFHKFLVENRINAPRVVLGMERFDIDVDSTGQTGTNRSSRRNFMAALGATATAAVAGCGAQSGDTDPTVDEDIVGTLLGSVTMYKSPTCECCKKYGDHLAAVDDVTMSTSETDDLSGVKSDFDVPGDLESCHTIDAGEYVIEGHVPLVALEKLATERPDVRGIALAGMPAGSPGMSGTKEGTFTVYAFSENSDPTVFADV